MKEELYGFDVLDNYIITCGDCNCKLASVVTIEDNKNRVNRGLKEITTSVKVIDCYKCGGESFKQEFDGTVIIGPINDKFDIEFVDTEVDENDIINNTIKVQVKQ